MLVLLLHYKDGLILLFLEYHLIKQMQKKFIYAKLFEAPFMVFPNFTMQMYLK